MANSERVYARGKYFAFTLSFLLILNSKTMNMNDFLKHVREKDTLTENGALVHSSTGDVLADQFGLASNYAGRDIDTVFAE